MSTLNHRCPLIGEHVCYYNNCAYWNATKLECTHWKKNYFKLSKKSIIKQESDKSQEDLF